MNTNQNKILVADDDPDILSIISNALEVEGYQVVVARDGKEALEKCQQQMPDLALLDYMMPNLSGPEVCQWIKKNSQSLVPVIIVTARTDLKDKVETLAAGADDYITKPFNYKELLARVSAQLRVRELNIALHEKNIQLQEMQQRLIEKERQILALQLGGTAAHQLGQPLSAIMLNCHLIEVLHSSDDRYKSALSAIKNDSKRMAELIEKLRNIDASQQSEYFKDTKILDLK